MNYLIYGVLRARDRVPDNVPPGVEGGEVSLLTVDSLAAGFSRVPPGGAVPTLPRLKAYARVVEALAESCTVLPLRYGCELSTRAGVEELLRERRAEFHGALEAVEGCVELGVHVLLGRRERPVCKNVGPPLGLSPGKAYLAGRETRYAAKDREAAESEVVARRIEKAFAGLRVRCRAEAPGAGRERLLTLHFLVRRQDQECFRQAFRRLEKSAPEKLLLTGPWPPYNFTSCHQATP